MTTDGQEPTPGLRTGGMTTEKVVEALRAARAKLGSHYSALTPRRLDDRQLAAPFNHLDRMAVFEHLAFMCEEAERMLAEGPQRREKVMRWLGFVQSSLWMLGLSTIAESKDTNRPEESKPTLYGGVQPMTGPPGPIKFFRPQYGSSRHDGYGGDDMHRGVETNRSGSNFIDGYEEGTFDK